MKKNTAEAGVHDFDFLVGEWNVRNRRLKCRFYTGSTLRLFNLQSEEWSLYWMTDRVGALLPPVVGRFENGHGEFYGDDDDAGRPIRVRFIWSKITSSSAQWEQAFSFDQGQTWETNWVMEMTRID
jgi:hypothetical protein